MTEIKAADADRFLAGGARGMAVVLVYGPDSGLVAERAALLLRGAIGEASDPFALVELDADTVASDPGRLSDEARAMGLFGGKRAIRLRVAGNRSVIPALEPLLDDPPVDCLIVIEAGELRKTASLRRLCEQSRVAAALPCYADDDAALDRLIDDETKTAGLVITADARAALRALLGRDRLASRSEVRKLCLYAEGNKAIELGDVEAVVGDGVAFALDALVDAVANGEPEVFVRAWRRLLAEGTPGAVAASSALRHFQALHRARALVDGGMPSRSVIERWTPPIFFQRRNEVDRQIRRWPRPLLERAMARIDQALLDSRLGAISDDIVAEALLAIAVGAARRQPA